LTLVFEWSDLLWLVYALAGEIWAAGPMVFDGYHNKPEDTAQAFGLLNGKKCVCQKA
jgi:long-subunit acyl-CoA synthetase (AMP-forming)